MRQLDDEMNKVRRTADMYIDSLVADMSNKTMARFGAFIVNNVLVKMYNQVIFNEEKRSVLAIHQATALLFARARSYPGYPH